MDINTGFKINELNGVVFLTIPSFEDAGGVMCAFSTRIGGVSPKPFDTLNFSRKREQSPVNFIHNLSRFAAAAGFDHKRAVAINYAHSAKLYRADAADAGRGIMTENAVQVCDGLYTSEKHIPIMSFHADCVPLFFYDPERRCAAVCHAGWRGVAAHIATNAVSALVSVGCAAKNILAAVGPCISSQHFEVGADVAEWFAAEFGSKTLEERNGSLYADLEKACLKDLTCSGIDPRNITLARLCTYKEERLFFSHRRDKGKTGAMAAVMMIKD